MMTERTRQRIINSEEAPALDSTIYPRLTKKPKTSNDLPYRKLYNLEIFNAAGTSYQSLEDLQNKGPFLARGSVPLKDTIRFTGDSKERGRLINIRAASIVEWTHEFNPNKVMEPVIWILSENVCWYQVQNMHPNYDPWIRPLADVCVYLDALIHAHFTLKVNDELKDLVPHLSTLLKMSTSAVLDALKEHQTQIVSLCKWDKELMQLKFVQAWTEEASRPPSTRQSTPDSSALPSTTTSTLAITTSAPEPTPALHGCETAMARTKASIKLAQRQAKELLSPPQHHSELEPVIVDSEGGEKAHKEKIGIYKGIPAPCPDNCPLHARKMVFDSNSLEELEVLLKARYDNDDNKDKDNRDKAHYSIPDNFQCPLDMCLINVSNSLSPTTLDFTELILQHLCEHDLTVSNMEHIRQYLTTSQPPLVKLEPKARNAQKQATGKALNVHLYWELQSGSFQFKAGDSHMSTSGARRQTALRNIPIQARGGRRQVQTRTIQRPALSDLEPRTHTQRRRRTLSHSDALQRSTAHDAQMLRFSQDRALSETSSNTEVSGDTPTATSGTVAEHKKTTTSRPQSRLPTYAFDMTDEDGDYEDIDVTGTEDETTTAGSRRQSKDRSLEAKGQPAQSQGCTSRYTSNYNHAKRDRSDSYDDDFMQPRHRTPYGNSCFESVSITASPVVPSARELIEVHGSDSEEASSREDDKGKDDSYTSNHLGRKRQRIMEFGSSRSSQHPGHRANRSGAFNPSHFNSARSAHPADTSISNDDLWRSWAKPTRIAMSYISPRNVQSGKKDV